MTLADLLARTGALLDHLRIPYAVIGGQAVLLHGMDRYTKDVDAVVADDSDLVQTFEDMVQRYYCPPDEGKL